MDDDRNIIQALPQCAVYDAQLLYTLRPGGCRFSNREFATWLSVNAMGFRQTTQMDGPPRSEEHTSELQSRSDLVCRLLLEKKKHESVHVYYYNKTCRAHTIV